MISPAAAPDRVLSWSPFAGAAALLACASPVVLAYNTAPSSTFLNQALACAGWGLYLWLLAARPLPAQSGRLAATRLLPAGLPLLLLAGAAAWAMVAGPLPHSLGLSALALLACALATLWVAAVLAAAGRLAELMPGWTLALLVAGLISAVIALVQVLAPEWVDGRWIAVTSLPGRASGNLRQPNHLSSLVLWSLVALVWWQATGRLALGWAAALAGLLVLAVVLSASRTGLVGVLMLGLWGLADRRLPARGRGLLLALPFAYAAMWLALAHWGSALEHPYGGTARFSAEGDISSSRFAIWSDTLALIARHPWAGVGFGEFNRAWSLTPFPHRPTAFFDHTHNLPLQFAVELGLPLALVLVGLLTWALWRAFTAASRAEGEAFIGLRCAFMMVLLIAVHSQLEYPLWYSYFLLPTAFALGLCLGACPAADRSDAVGAAPGWHLQWIGAFMLAGSVHAVVDYWKVVVIFTPGPDAAPLAERIAAGERSVYFAHHAHYAAATTAAEPAQAMPSFSVASHFLLDTRLMLAWAKAYAEAGDSARARHLADRLREFRNGASKAFFDACTGPASAAAAGTPASAPPFQCTPAEVRLDDRDFR
jgi:O-antigen ligase